MLETKKIILSKIHTYKKRRNELRAEYGNGWHYNKEYARRSRTITARLAAYVFYYNDWDFRHRVLKVIHNHVCIFLGMDNGKFRNLKELPTPTEKLGIRIFCKFVLENIEFGITGRTINEFVGSTATNNKYSWYIRSTYNKSLLKHPERREVYKKFREYFKEVGSIDLQKEIEKFPNRYILERRKYHKKIARS